jgi:hypothetical protein
MITAKMDDLMPVAQIAAYQDQPLAMTQQN